MSEPKQIILAVDDEPKNLKIISLSLSDQWELLLAPSGEAALETMESNKPDVVLLDIMMPGKDGYQVCRELRARPELKFMKIILVSGKSLLEERLLGYEAGADDYITKPFVPEEMSAKISVFARLAKAERTLDQLNRNLQNTIEEKTSELVQASAQVAHAGRLASLGEMAGGVAHEINTPLAVIDSLGTQIDDMIDDGKIDSERLKVIGAKIKSTTARISKIVSGLQVFARGGGTDPAHPVHLASIVEDTLGLCSERFKSGGVNLEVGNCAEIIVECRSIQISQVLLNLLNNAFDAIQNNGEKWIRLSFVDLNESIEIRVSDSGAGLPENVRAKLFQPFFTTKEVGKGTGLGLGIARGIMNSHGGSIELLTGGPNTCFLLRLPKKQLEPTKSIPPHTKAS
jgi:signal transduction histidine kinase